MIRGAPPKPYNEIPSLLIQRAIREQATLAKSAVIQISNNYMDRGAFVLLLDVGLVRYERSIKNLIASCLSEVISSQDEVGAKVMVKAIDSLIQDSPARVKAILKLIDLERREDMLRSAESPSKLQIELLFKLIRNEKRENVLDALVLALVNPLQKIPNNIAVELAAEAVGEDEVPWQLFSVFEKMLPGMLDGLETGELSAFLDKVGTINHPDKIEIIGSVLLNEKNAPEIKNEAARMLGTSWNLKAIKKLGLAIRDPNPVLRRNVYEYAKQANLGGLDEDSKKIASAAEEIILAGVINAQEDPRIRIDLLRWISENGGTRALEILGEIDVMFEKWNTLLRGEQEKEIKLKLAQGIEHTMQIISKRKAKIRHERITDPAPKKESVPPKKASVPPNIPPSRVARGERTYTQIRNSTDMERLARKNLQRRNMQTAIKRAK